MNYNKTLNLPRTDFAMRADLPRKEPGILKFWEDIDIYRLVREHRKGAPLFILHDGPPYANGKIHMGTALNKVLKDIVIKYSTMKGMDAPYVPGWDTHGLPIELQVIRHKKVKRDDFPPLEFRKLCRDYALKYLDIQREQFYRLGVRGDWENPYITLDPSFEAKQIEVFGTMARKGFIYKGLKPVYWCPDCETALAEAEIEYEDIESHSIYVKFPVTVASAGRITDDTRPVFCMIWTTTPWTIPANLAIALNPEFDYVLVDAGDELYILAEGLWMNVMQVVEQEWTVSKRFKGSELEGIKCAHPLYQRESPVVMSAEFVTLEQGTGLVHIAPGHGLEDYEVGTSYGLGILSPIDGRGYFTEEAGELAGLRYDRGNEEVLHALAREGSLLKSDAIQHQYPHCWRCKKPVIFRATEQWFASIKGFREEALQAIREVNWYPRWGGERIYNMVNDRQDWCISRQRIWGVPIPIFYCRSCDEPIINDRTIDAVQSLFAREGSDAWFKYDAEQILPPGTVCEKCGKNEFRKEEDIMDVWFDSGSSHIAVCENHEDLRWPADLYLEGSDQYRGWFQSSLLTSVAVKGEPPYRSVISHGWVVDGEGKKMSKSLGNVISPDEIIKDYGADILRLWVSSADFTRDIHLSENILKQLVEVYRKIRNTSRFLLGNLFDYEPTAEGIPYDRIDELDRWVLARMQILIQKVTRAYDDHEYHQVFHAIHNFCVVDMSNFYLNINKDKLYCSHPRSVSRRATQAVMFYILKQLSLMISPILTFTAEELWQCMPEQAEKSIQLAEWPSVVDRYCDEELLEKWEHLLETRDEVLRALELARNRKEIGDTLEAEVILWGGEEIYASLQPFRDDLANLLIISELDLREGLEAIPEEAWRSDRLPLAVQVARSSNRKCTRCWAFRDHIGEKGICSRCEAVVAKLVEEK